MRVKAFFLVFRRHLEISINFVIQFQKCLLSLIIKTVHTYLNCLRFIVKDTICLNNMNQATSTDNFLNTTIIKGLTNNICPIRKTLQKSASLQSLFKIFSSIFGVGYSCSKVTGNRSRNASLSTLVPTNRPSSEPLPLVFAVAMTLKPAVGRTNLPIFLRKTPFPSRID